MWLFVLFLAIPLIEIALFIQVGGAIGLWPTLLVVIVTAIVGTFLVKTQGAAALMRMRQSFSELSDPAEPLAHGAMILFAGALLLTPGFFTDAVGFLLLFPPFRMAAYAYARKRINVQRFEMGSQSPHEGRPQPPRDTVVEGEFEEVNPTHKPDGNPSGWTRH